LFQYFTDMVWAMKHPTNDITSIVANAKIKGESIPQFEMLSYYFLLVVAGNETRATRLPAGCRLSSRIGRVAKLRRNPSLIDSAVEEIVRWTTPVIQFARTASADTEIRGQKIRAGESMCLFYPREIAPRKFSSGRSNSTSAAIRIRTSHLGSANISAWAPTCATRTEGDFQPVGGAIGSRRTGGFYRAPALEFCRRHQAHADSYDDEGRGDPCTQRPRAGSVVAGNKKRTISGCRSLDGI